MTMDLSTDHPQSVVRLLTDYLTRIYVDRMGGILKKTPPKLVNKARIIVAHRYILSNDNSNDLLF